MTRTSDGFIVSAIEAVEVIREAHRDRAMAHAVDRFVQLLGALPDYPAAEFVEADLGRVRMLADAAIDRIERAAEGAGSPGTQLALVSAVYAIRKRLEDIDAWWRHATGAGPPGFRHPGESGRASGGESG
jgi:hypothetical protein